MFKVIYRVRRRLSSLNSSRTDARLRGDRGAVAVEFAIIIPLFLFILFFMIDVGRYVVVRMALTGAAEQGARAIAYGATSSQSSSIIRGAMSLGVIRLSTMDNTTDATSVSPAFWSCPANSETVSDLTCISSTDATNWAVYNCSGSGGTNYRAKAAAYLDFKWLTPLQFAFQYVDPNMEGVPLTNVDRDSVGITSIAKSICQN